MHGVWCVVLRAACTLCLLSDAHLLLPPSPLKPPRACIFLALHRQELSPLQQLWRSHTLGRLQKALVSRLGFNSAAGPCEWQGVAGWDVALNERFCMRIRRVASVLFGCADALRNAAARRSPRTPPLCASEATQRQPGSACRECSLSPWSPRVAERGLPLCVSTCERYTAEACMQASQQHACAPHHRVHTKRQWPRKREAAAEMPPPKTKHGKSATWGAEQSCCKCDKG